MGANSLARIELNESQDTRREENIGELNRGVQKQI